MLWTSGQILTEPLYTFLVSVAIYATLLAFSSGKPERRTRILLAAGLLFGFAALIRPVALAAVVALACTMTCRAFWLRHWGDLGGAAVVVAASLSVLLPWAIRNKAVMGSFSFVSTEAGEVFWLGNNPAYDSRDSSDFEMFGGYTPTKFARPAETAGKNEVEVNRIYRDAALEHIRRHPSLFVTRGLHKLWNMWRPVYSHSSLRHQVVGWTLYVSLLGVSLYGAIASYSSRHLVWPLWIYLLVHLGVYFAVVGEIRFRVPLWPALIPFGAMTICRRRRRTEDGGSVIGDS